MCPYDEILSASDLNSFFLFRSARLARTTSVSSARRHIAVIPVTEMINATHQCSGTDERRSGKECITGIFLLEIRHRQNTCHNRLRDDTAVPRCNASTLFLVVKRRRLPQVRYASAVESTRVGMRTASHAQFWQWRLRRFPLIR